MPVAAGADLPLPAAILFDLDGTLVDTVDTRIRAWTSALAEAELPVTRAQVAPLIGCDGRRLARDMAAAAGRILTDTAVEELDRRAGELYERLNRDPQPLPGLMPLLAALQRRGISWAIATSSRREQVATSVAALHLKAAPRVIDGTRVRMAKPDPELLLTGARELGVAPGLCWCVGDSMWDMRAAVAGGMTAVAVRAGSAVGDTALLAAGATVLVDTLDEIAHLLDGAAGGPR